VVGQVTVASFLIFGSLLCVRSLMAIRDADPGFAIDAVAVASVDTDRQRDDADDALKLADAAVASVRALPGVRAASVTSLIPLGGDVASSSFEVAGEPPRRTETFLMNVGAQYFQTMNIPVQRGREFTAQDANGAPPRAIVNAAFVRMYGLDDPLGARVRRDDREPWLEIVGVVSDSKYGFFAETTKPTLYRPYAQTGGRLFVVARGTGAPGDLLSPIRGALSALAPTRMVTARTLRDATALEGSLRRALSSLLGGVGLLGLALALVGLYGLLAYTVSRRIREMGIRLALGATTASLRLLILGDAMRLIGIGAGLGILAATVAARPLTFALSGIRSTDLAANVLTVAMVLGSGLMAAYRPAVLATRANPADTLRAE
jgi:predicted permease